MPTPAPGKVVVAKPAALPTFPLPDLPHGKLNNHQFNEFMAAVLKEVDGGKLRIIRATHKLTGQYINSKDLVNDSSLLKETVASAERATRAGIKDSDKLSQYTKNVLLSLTAMQVDKENTIASKSEVSEQLPALDKAFTALSTDLRSMHTVLADLLLNAESDDRQYLEDSLQNGSALLDRINDDITDVKSATYNLRAAIHGERTL
jgi:hypothetical protein